MHSFPPLDVSIPPSYDTFPFEYIILPFSLSRDPLIYQDPFIPINPPHNRIPNQDQNIPYILSINGSPPCQDKITPSHSPIKFQDKIIPSSPSNDPSPSQDLTYAYAPPYEDLPCIQSSNFPSCQDTITPSHDPISSTPLYDPLSYQDPIIPSTVPHNPHQIQDQSTPSSPCNDPNPSQDSINPHNLPHDPHPPHDPNI